MNGLSDLSEGQAPTLEKHYIHISDSIPIEENESFLSAYLEKKKIDVQNQFSQIKDLKSSVKRDIQIMENLDKALPIEEEKTLKLMQENSFLQNKFKQLQAEMQQYSEKDCLDDQSVSQNKEPSETDVLKQKNKEKSFVEKSNKQKKELNDHIKTLKNLCTLLNDDIEVLKSAKSSHLEAKNQVENMKNEFESETEKIEQIKKKQLEMADFLKKTEISIQEYKDKNLKAEIELYDQLKLKDSINAKRKQLCSQFDVEPDIIQQNLDEAQRKLQQKELLLQNEKELYYLNEEKIKLHQTKLREQKKVIHRLKRHLKLFDAQIQQEEYLMFVMRQQHEQLRINTTQFSAQIEQSVKNIEKIKKEKKLMKKELENAKDLANKLQNKISSEKSYDLTSPKEKGLGFKSNIPPQEVPLVGNSNNNFDDYQDTRQNADQDTYQDSHHNYHQDDYHDNTARTIEIMRRQSNNLKKNQNQFQNIRFDQQLLNKRIKNCHTSVINRQYKRDSLFPTSRDSSK